MNNATNGGGIAFFEGVLENNVIARNTAINGGGLYSCNGTIEDNLIYDNTGQNGGGAYLSWGTFQRNRVYSNDATDSGGGFNLCDGIIQNNMIYNNTAVSYGGGVYRGTGIFRHNTVYGNESDFVGGGISFYTGSIKNCIVWANTAPNGAQLGNATNPAHEGSRHSRQSSELTVFTQYLHKMANQTVDVRAQNPLNSQRLTIIRNRRIARKLAKFCIRDNEMSNRRKIPLDPAQSSGAFGQRNEGFGI